ncbi:MAG: transporter substrate-binding domain-containing protein, partial [Oscillospiraceae bacterium]
MKKFLTIVCAATLALSLFACGTGTPSTSGNANGESDKSEKADTSWTDIEKAGKIVIGVDDEFPPMGFLDEKGEITGFDIDLATTVCEKLGVKAEFKD